MVSIIPLRCRSSPTSMRETPNRLRVSTMVDYAKSSSMLVVSDLIRHVPRGISLLHRGTNMHAILIHQKLK
jgi:hypothetical protein